MRKYFAEAIATFCLLLIGTGSVILDHKTAGGVSLLGISLITGLVVTIMILLVGKMSGAHMNPAVTLALIAKKELSFHEFAPYLLAQAIGAFAGTFTLSLIFGYNYSLGETIPSIQIGYAFIIEVVLSFFLLLTIFYSSDRFPVLAPWIIGLYVAIGIFLGGNYSGGSMNPIRSLSPAVLNDNYAGQWIFFTAPFIGAVLATIIYKNKKA
ncbi:MAG: aquaporin [Bacteroidetes bacterium]|nr:aquaporin [Bacteroidota bacterium]